MLLLKCCTQYVSKFERLRSSCRTGKGQFSFQSQRRTMPKNVQTARKLHSLQMLPRLCSKSCKLAFSSMWTESFQMWKLLSCVLFFATPWTVAHQAPLSREFSRQEYWSGLPFSSPADLPNPWIEPKSPALQADSLPSEPPGKPSRYIGWV